MLSGHPSGRILPRAGFSLRYLQPPSPITSNNLQIMKPILQINDEQRGSSIDKRERCRQRRFPLTNCNYRPTTEAEVTSPAGTPAVKSPGFHKLSSEFFGAETSRNYVVELSFFVLIIGIAAWPVVSMLIAVVRMIRNY